MRNSPQPGTPPHLLLLATQPWPTGARLGLAMRSAGFRVSIWSPRTHPALLTGALERSYLFSALKPLDSLEAAVVAACPDLIVPCDDMATVYVQQLAERALTRQHLQDALHSIQQSLGAPANLNRLTSRTGVLVAAAQGGIAVPANARIGSAADLRAWCRANGFPAYLKADGSSGGIGIRLVHSEEEAVTALRVLNAPPGPLRAVKRMIVDRDPTLVGPLLRPQRPVISVQRAIPGVDANSAIFCWQGRVLASIAMQVLATRYPRGPSTILRRVHSAAMDHAAEVLASRLQLTGFYGLDFILDAQTDAQTGDEQTGGAWLIEMNNRATQIAHLALGPDHDLPAAAFAAITGKPVQPRAVVTSQTIITLFPQDSHRDPANSLNGQAYHDVPWEAPELMHAYVDRHSGWRRWLKRQYWRDRRQPKRNFEALASAETTPPRQP
jgi:hypothetical protein